MSHSTTGTVTRTSNRITRTTFPAPSAPLPPPPPPPLGSLDRDPLFQPTDSWKQKCSESQRTYHELNTSEGGEADEEEKKVSLGCSVVSLTPLSLLPPIAD
jgi:hypothetical protein